MISEDLDERIQSLLGYNSQDTPLNAIRVGLEEKMEFYEDNFFLHKEKHENAAQIYSKFMNEYTTILDVQDSIGY